ncbi:MAG: outer membrane protein assembly factor BamB family protein [Planctomycetota bacterium]|jgi:hypothetical protein
MAMRLFVICLLATAFACKSKQSREDEQQTSVSGGSKAASASTVGRDDVEKALLGLGIPGRVLRYDLNEADWKEGPVEVRQVHLLSDTIVLEGKQEDAPKLRIYAMDRASMNFKWVSELNEPTMFRASESDDAVFLLSLHYLHAFEKRGGQGAMMFVGGPLDGVRKPPLRLPFRPTGSCDGQSDTVYIPTFGAADSNKNIESFSLVTGDRGWGYRASADIMTAAKVGGTSGDPKLYWVTRTGHITCMQASNYGFAPRAPDWEALLEAGVKFDFALTEDTTSSAGALFLMDDEGMVYCLDRITGKRRWTNATKRRATAAPQVFGNLCVVSTEKGLVGFDRDNVLYDLTAADGDGKGETTTISTAGGSLGGLTFEVQNEVLYANGKFKLNGRSTTRAGLRGGDTITIGDTNYDVTDRGTAPLWVDLDYERILARIDDNLLAVKGTTVHVINARTGEASGTSADFGGARFIPTNTWDRNVFVVAGDAIVYALYPR